jgi:stage II sporulation protein D
VTRTGAAIAALAALGLALAGFWVVATTAGPADPDDGLAPPAADRSPPLTAETPHGPERAGAPERAGDGLALPVAEPRPPQVTRPQADLADNEATGALGDLSEGPADVVAVGAGWGHGVGLSQYGARAMARHGHDHRAILDHYYPDTRVTEHNTGHALRVGLLSPTSRPTDRMRVTSRRTWETGAVFATAGGERVPLPTGQPVTVTADDDEVVAHPADGPRLRGARLTLDWDAGATGGAAVAFSGVGGAVDATRWGRVEVTAIGGALRPVLVIDVPRYLRGLAEMPPSWPAASLRAQAVAARTYALRVAASGVNTACDCHLGPTAASQAFRGGPRRAAARPWLAAVADTAGQVVTRDGGLVWAYYSSSHGGRTERTVDSFAFGRDDGQWPSVDDPWSLDPAADNPKASWQVTISHDAFLEALGVPLQTLLGVDVVARTAGGSPHTLRLVGLLPNAMPVVGTWPPPGAGDDGAGARLRAELGADVLPSQQLTELRVATGG